MSFEIVYAQYSEKKGAVTVELIRKDSVGVKSQVTEKWEAPVHPDLKKAQDAMAPHLAILCGYVKTTDVADIKKADPDLFEGFHITGYQYVGAEDDPKIMVTGYYQHALGTTILNTKGRRLQDEGEDSYIFMDDFKKKVERCDKEYRAYLDGTKRGKDPQGNLFEGEEKDAGKAGKTTVKVLPEEKPIFNTPGMAKMPTADKETMKRVAAGFAEDEKNQGNKSGIEDAHVISETKNTPTAVTPASIVADIVNNANAGKSGKGAGKKRVAQTPEVRNGIIEDNDARGLEEGK